MEDYLSHHGIKGQKWGQQNGPPYPLPSIVSSAVKKAVVSGAIKKAKDTVKNYKIKRKRKASLEKARATKAEKKAQREEQNKKEEKARKREEAYKKFVEGSKKADEATQAVEKYANSYNRIVKLANPFIENRFDTKLPILGENNKREKLVNDLIKNGDAQGLWANRTKLSDTQVNLAVTRLKNYQKLERAAKGESISDDDEKKKK